MKARENPFASHRIERLAYRFPVDDGWNPLLARLEAQNWRGAIVGPHGTGKTTLIEQLAPQLTARGFQPRLLGLRAEDTATEKRAILNTVFEATDFLLLDGAEQLSVIQWLSFQAMMRNVAGCVLTVHRAGRLPTLLQTTPSPRLLAELIERLSGATLPENEVAALFRKHRSNLRECLRSLYDRWADDDGWRLAKPRVRPSLVSV